MNQSDNFDSTVKVLYRSLLVGQLILVVVIGVLVNLNAPLIGAFPLLEYTIIGAGLILLIIARWILRPRVAPKLPEVEPCDYWADTRTRSAVQLVWFLTEGASIFTLIGYLLTGNIVVALVALVALYEFASARPAYFETRTVA